MSRNTHDASLDHHGTALAEQIATGTPTAGYVPVSAGAGSPPAWGSVSAGSGITVTDGTHTVADATSLSVTGGTVGGTTPSATLTITGGGSLTLGGLPGSAATGTGGAVGTSTHAAESDHQHPAQSLLRGTSVNQIVAAVSVSPNAFDQAALRVRSDAVAALTFLMDSTHGVELVGLNGTETGASRFKLGLAAIGGSDAVLDVGAAGSIWRAGATNTALWDEDIGVKVAPETHTHETVLVVSTAVTRTANSYALIAELTTTSFGAATWEVDSVVLFSTGATANGIGLGISAPPATISGARITIPTSDSTEVVGTRLLVAESASSASATSVYAATLKAVVKTSATGAFAIEFKSPDGSHTVTVREGSYLRLRLLSL